MTELRGRKYRALFAMPLRSQTAFSATRRAKDKEARLAHAFDRLQAIPYCPKTVLRSLLLAVGDGLLTGCFCNLQVGIKTDSESAKILFAGINTV